MLEQEMKQRQRIAEMKIPSKMVDPISTAEDKDQCAECRTYCFLSCVTCDNNSDMVLCLAHADKKYCKCENPQLQLQIRYSEDTLRGLLKKVEEIADKPTELRDKILKLSSSERKPTIEDYESLLQLAIEEDNANELEDIKELQTLIMNCKKWCEAVQKIMTRRKGKGRQPNRSLERVAELIDQLDVLSFTAPEVEQLTKAYQRALELDKRATELEDASEIDPAEIKALQEEGYQLCIDIESVMDLEFTSPEAQEFVEQHFETKPLNQYSLEEVTVLKEKAESLNLHAHKFYDEMVDAIGKTESWIVSVEELLRKDVLDVDLARRYITSSSKWPKSLSHISQLKQLMDDYKHWKKSASEVLNRDTEFDEQELSLELALSLPVDTAEKLERLIADGSRFDCSEISRLANALTDSKNWKSQLSKFFAASTGIQIDVNVWLTDFEIAIQYAIEGHRNNCFCNTDEDNGPRV
jgi:histone demethylase JARID1